MHEFWNVSPIVRRLLGCILLAIPLLGGCFMHSFGQGARADMHGRPAVDRQVTTLVKEVQGDDVTATLEIPPLRAGKESELIVRVRDSGDGEPIRGARVSIAVMSLRGTGDPEPGGGTVTYHAEASSHAGVYVASHRFEQIGSYEIMAEIHAGAESTYQPMLVVSARQDAFSEMGSVSRKMRTPLFVLGAAGMLVMMGFFMF